MKLFELHRKRPLSKRDRLLKEAVESTDLDTVVSLLQSENPDLFIKYNDRLIRMATRGAIKNERFTDFDSIMDRVVRSLAKTVNVTANIKEEEMKMFEMFDSRQTTKESTQPSPLTVLANKVQELDPDVFSKYGDEYVMQILSQMLQQDGSYDELAQQAMAELEHPDVYEARGDSLKRRFNKGFWWDGYVSPQDALANVNSMSDEALLKFQGGVDVDQPAGDGTPREFQIKIINRELRRRGYKDFKKNMKEGTMTEANTGPTPAQHETMDNLIAKGGELYNKAKLVKGDEVAYLGSINKRKFAMFPSGKFESASEFHEFQREGWTIEPIFAPSATGK